MNSRRKRLVLFTAVGLALIAVLGYSRAHLPIAWFVGGTYDVLFSKGLVVEFMAGFSHPDATLVSVEGKYACFSDNSGKLVGEIPGEFAPEINGYREIWVYHRDGGELCVRAAQISSLSKSGVRVWGTGSAIGTPGA